MNNHGSNKYDAEEVVDEQTRGFAHKERETFARLL